MMKDSELHRHEGGNKKKREASEKKREEQTKHVEIKMESSEINTRHTVD